MLYLSQIVVVFMHLFLEQSGSDFLMIRIRYWQTSIFGHNRATFILVRRKLNKRIDQFNIQEIIQNNVVTLNKRRKNKECEETK